ncbi:Clp protease ClpP [Vreelandella populi]|uniref:Clp protease ClpP n=1 Tax=Vreelandella populi TaxID=2498858 RepID=UPI000F8C4432|nr:Clp protease ClpP [Halomonas populi]RUR51520.1 Clp protease ClpP [Halomonas populi]
MPWFKARALADNPRVAHIAIDHPIGSDWAPDWISDFTGEKPAREFIAAVDALGELDEIHLELNCPGGDVASGVRIHNYLKGHRAKVHTKVTGQAASIAVTIMLAGDTRTMGIGTTVMTHRASSLMVGFFNAKEMQDTAANLTKFDDAIVSLFVAETGKTAEEVNALLDQGDTVMGADEAIEWGLATAKDAQLQAVACADMAQFKKALEQHGEVINLRAQVAGNPTTMSAADALALAFDLTPEEAETQAADLGDQIIALRQQSGGGGGEGQPLALIASALGLEASAIQQTPQNAVDAIQALQASQPDQVLTAERTRVNSIIKACQTTGQPQLMDKLISNGMSETQASEYVYDVAAAGGDSQNIQNSHSPEGGQGQSSGVSYTKAYSRFNRKTPA